MTNLLTKIQYAINVITAAGLRMIFGWSEEAYKGTRLEADSNSVSSMPLPTFLSDASISNAMRKIFAKNDNLQKLSDEALIKICRQLEFWYTGENLNAEDMTALVEQLVDQSLWFHNHLSETPSTSGEPTSSMDTPLIKVPTTRFGKTEIQMPLITCGGMRLQNSWIPDSIPILRPNRSFVLKSPPQQNMKDCIRTCLKVGINHFETARMYGTSEYQMVEALYELMQEGEVKREDFILQTKVVPSAKKAFVKSWEMSWDNIRDKLGYIDLFALHAVAHVNEDLYDCIEFSDQLKKDGKIRHLGFSTHTSSAKIMELINTDRFDYVNLHYHYFGSYHGAGTPDTNGGEGNFACVQRARELDMGVFQISPCDKGGKLFEPSNDCASLIGKELTPIGFALLYAWRKGGIDTSSVGIGRSSDLDEAMGAIRLMNLAKKGKVDIDKKLDDAMDRLRSRAEEKQGKEWVERGLLNIPSMYEESSDGIAIGHILWLHDLLVNYGMYDFCRDRYDGLVDTNGQWDKKKSFQENVKKMSTGNPGRAYDDSVDLSDALKDHYDPLLVIKKLEQTHKWLGGDDRMSKEELKKMGWKRGYNLTTWTEMPGKVDSRNIVDVLVQNITGGRMGLTGLGPGETFRAQANQLRRAL